MCDLAYVLLLGKLEHEQQLAVVLLAAGAKGVEVPTQERLDAALVEQPRLLSADDDQAQLRRALGLAA